MTKLYNKGSMVFRRKELRNNPTFDEAVLWKLLRKFLKEFQFRRQYSVGGYILDFYSIKYRVAVELDGNHHTKRIEYDTQRDNFLRACNIMVMRFWNQELREDPGIVVQKIRNALDNNKSLKAGSSPL